MQICILTYYRLRKREPLIALGSHQGEGGLLSASAVPPRRTDLNTVALRRWSETTWSPFTTRAVSRRTYSTTPYPQGEYTPNVKYFMVGLSVIDVAIGEPTALLVIDFFFSFGA